MPFLATSPRNGGTSRWTCLEIVCVIIGRVNTQKRFHNMSSSVAKNVTKQASFLFAASSHSRMAMLKDTSNRWYSSLIMSNYRVEHATVKITIRTVEFEITSGQSELLMASLARQIQPELPTQSMHSLLAFLHKKSRRESFQCLTNCWQNTESSRIRSLNYGPHNAFNLRPPKAAGVAKRGWNTLDSGGK